VSRIEKLFLDPKFLGQLTPKLNATVNIAMMKKSLEHFFSLNDWQIDFVEKKRFWIVSFVNKDGDLCNQSRAKTHIEHSEIL